jgi:LAS superfamily LD-carboxypeptidase LdcB
MKSKLNKSFTLTTPVFVITATVFFCSGYISGVIVSEKLQHDNRMKKSINPQAVTQGFSKHTPSLPLKHPPNAQQQNSSHLAVRTNGRDINPVTPDSKTPYHFYYSENTSRLTVLGNFYDVQVLLDRVAADAFVRMKKAAQTDGVYLEAVSGFRSHKDQERLFQKQILKRGSRLEASRVSAPAGYSEHHTGYALDIGEKNNKKDLLTTSFETTDAFRWLNKNASYFGFELSYPRSNPMNISYEPWHWRFVGSQASMTIFNPARTILQPAFTNLHASPP